jgi:hypothetical protein
MFFMSKLGLDRDNDSDRTQLLITNNEDPAKGPEKLSHLSAVEYLQCGHISRDEFSSYYKFSFVRNPWSRLVSEYRYRNFLSHKSFKDFVLNKLPSPGMDDKYRHIMPQTDMLYDADGTLLVDFVGKFEQLDKDFKQVCDRLGFDHTTLPHVNSSDKKSREVRRKFRNFIHHNNEANLSSYVDFYDDETLDFVSHLYRKDIENFDYSFEDALKKG